MIARHFLGRFTTWIVLIALSAALSLSIAEAVESKFHPASGFDPVIGHYLVTLSSVADTGSTAEALARSYGGQIEGLVSPDARTFAVTMLPSRVRTLSADPRVREVAEIAQPDARETPPVAPRRASLTSPHLVPHQLSTSGTYTYDGSGNIKGIGTDSSFVYDVEGRLVDATVQNNEQKYEYDIYGNRTNAYRVGAAVACLGNTTCEAPVTMSETPSATNHLAGVTYDDAGNVKQGYDATYVYDGTGMMTRAAVGTDIRNFVYTADDERIAVRQGLSWTWSVRDQSGKVLREFTSMESTPFALSAHVWSKDYVWRDGQLLASTSIPAGYSSPVTYHCHLNHLGTPRMITRDNGIVMSNHNYYPFGSEMDQPPQESPVEAMKFTGHERDIIAGSNHSVDYMHARYYNASVGRFLSVDPSLDIDGSMHLPQKWNRYAYVGNNPLKYTDPDGKDWLAAWLLGESYRNVSTWDAIFSRDTISDVNRGRQEWAEDHQAITHGFSPVPTSKSEVAMQVVMMGPIGEFIGTSFGKLGKVIANQVGKITGFSGHAIDSIVTRGVSPALLKAVTSKPVAVLEQSAGRKLFLTKEGAVVLDKGGKVVTAYTAKEFDKKILDVLEKAAVAKQ